MKAKVGKYLLVLATVGFIAGGLYYLNLSNRHKAIVKTTLLHKLGLVDNQWHVSYTDSSTIFVTPTMVIDNIYKSMEGPKAMRAFQLNPEKSELLWINSFKTTAISTNENDVLSNDYICHSNVDYYDGEHFGKWQMPDRIGQQYPRLTSMSNGIESYSFPKGFGFPLFSDEYLFLSSQILNHNIKSRAFSVKHKLELGYAHHNDSIKPLMSKTLFIALPVISNNNTFDYNALNQNKNACLPVDTKNHMYLNENGQQVSGHWFISPGKSNYKSDVTKQLHLKEPTPLLFAAVHLHPFAESLTFRDKTIDSIIFTSHVENYTEKIGLKKVTEFSSKKGVILYPDHNYELEVEINNTTDTVQDMMASIFIFLYDKEMHEKTKKYKGL